MNDAFKLMNVKNLTDPYEFSVKKNPKKGGKDDLEGEKAQKSDKEPNKVSPDPKDYMPPIPFLNALK